MTYAWAGRTWDQHGTVETWTVDGSGFYGSGEADGGAYDTQFIGPHVRTLLDEDPADVTITYTPGDYPTLVVGYDPTGMGTGYAIEAQATGTRLIPVRPEGWVSSVAAWNRDTPDSSAGQTIRMRVDGGHVQVWHDDVLRIDWTDPDPLPTGPWLALVGWDGDTRWQSLELTPPLVPVADIRDVEVRVYDKTGAGPYTVLHRAKGVQWSEEGNGQGVGQFTLHSHDEQATKALLSRGNIVKFWYAGASEEAFAIKIRRHIRKRVSRDEAAGKTVTVAGFGVASICTSGVVFGEFGNTRRSPDARGFNYGSLSGEWYSSGEWSAAVESDVGTDGRVDEIVDWPAAAASTPFIWAGTDGSVNVPAGSVAFFRDPFTLTAEKMCVLFATADDGLELKLDGETIIPMSSVESRNWKVTKPYEIILAPGEHLIAARVDNQAAFDSPAGLRYALHELDVDGKPGALITQSDSSTLARPGPTVPGWRKAHIFRKLFTENRDTYGASIGQLSVGFTANHDSDSEPWVDDIGKDRSFPVGASLLEVLTMLAEEGDFDWSVDSDMTIRAYRHKGSASGVTLTEGHNLIELNTEVEDLQATRLLIRTRDGFLDVGHASEATEGTHYGFLSLGEVEDDATATAIGSNMLNLYANPQTSHSIEVAVRSDCVPYLHYRVGDTVTAPDEWGDPATLRIVALTMMMDEHGRMRPVPEFVAA